MAQIPTTNVKLRSNIRQEYGGSSGNVSLGNYYRYVDNTGLVDNSAMIPANPRYYFNQYYTPNSNGSGSGGSTNYAKKTTILRDVNGTYIPNTDITREWRYGSTNPFATTVDQNTAGTNPSAPGSFYGDTSNYFYFTPDTNYPWSGQSRSVQSMFVFNSVTVFGSGATQIQLWQNYYGLWRTKGKAAYRGYYNQNIPQNGANPPDISMSNFRGQYNP